MSTRVIMTISRKANYCSCVQLLPMFRLKFGPGESCSLVVCVAVVNGRFYILYIKPVVTLKFCRLGIYIYIYRKQIILKKNFFVKTKVESEYHHQIKRLIKCFLTTHVVVIIMEYWDILLYIIYSIYKYIYIHIMKQMVLRVINNIIFNFIMQHFDRKFIILFFMNLELKQKEEIKENGQLVTCSWVYV